jgi:ribonuclease HII
VRSCSTSGRERAKRRRSNDGCAGPWQSGIPDIEARLRESGARLVVGVDEAGRGPLAGPVVASAVILEDDQIPWGITDSKKLSHTKRLEMYCAIMQSAVSVSVGVVSARSIDRMNILRATLLAMSTAVNSLDTRPDCAIVDGNAVPDLPIPVIAIVKGDERCFSVAAASIVAKVTRDTIMERLDIFYPRYAFRNNKGYGTRQHIAALRAHGPTRLHRLTFEPVWSSLREGL